MGDRVNNPFRKDEHQSLQLAITSILSHQTQ
jgi:hypothetical protein